MRKSGFTLSELLIALAILGVIASFSIPKVLQSQQDGKYKAMGKEAISAVAEAFQIYQSKTQVSAGTNTGDVAQYLNYVKKMTAGELIDNEYGNTGSPGGGSGCNANAPCYRLHNGGALGHWGLAGTGNGSSFGGTSPTHFIYFYFDPDGVATSPAVATGPSKSLLIFLYANGKISSAGECKTASATFQEGSGIYTGWCPTVNPDPPWFNWN